MTVCSTGVPIEIVIQGSSGEIMLPIQYTFFEFKNKHSTHNNNNKKHIDCKINYQDYVSPKSKFTTKNPLIACRPSNPPMVKNVDSPATAAP